MVNGKVYMEKSAGGVAKWLRSLLEGKGLDGTNPDAVLESAQKVRDAFASGEGGPKFVKDYVKRNFKASVEEAERAKGNLAEMERVLDSQLRQVAPRTAHDLRDYKILFKDSELPGRMPRLADQLESDLDLAAKSKDYAAEWRSTFADSVDELNNEYKDMIYNRNLSLLRKGALLSALGAGTGGYAMYKSGSVGGKADRALEKLASVTPYVDYILSSRGLEKLAGLDLVKLVPGVTRAVKGATRASGHHIPSGPTIRMGTTRHIPSGPTIQIPSYEVGAYTGNMARGFENTAGAIVRDAADVAASAASRTAGSASKLPKTLPQRLLSGQRGFFGRLGEGTARLFGGGKNIDAYQSAIAEVAKQRGMADSLRAFVRNGDVEGISKVLSEQAAAMGKPMHPDELRQFAQYIVKNPQSIEGYMKSSINNAAANARALAGSARAEANAYNHAAKVGTGVVAGGAGLAGAYGLGHSNGVDSGVEDFKANQLPQYLTRAATIGHMAAQNQANNAGFMDRLGYLFTGNSGSLNMNNPLQRQPSRTTGGFMV